MLTGFTVHTCVQIFPKKRVKKKKNAGAVLQKSSKILLYSIVQYSISTAVTLVLGLLCTFVLNIVSNIVLIGTTHDKIMPIL